MCSKQETANKFTMYSNANIFNFFLNDKQSNHKNKFNKYNKNSLYIKIATF
jgi:hypothetical protein